MFVPIFFLLAAALDPTAVNDASQAGPVRPGAKGPAVLRAQILLGRAHYSPGQIDGSYGSNLGKAIAAYRSEHELGRGEVATPAVWTLLNADTAPALTTYTISPEDVKGPFQKVPAEMKDKAKLPHLGYESAEDALSEKFHAAPALLHALNPGKSFDEAGTEITVPNVIVARPAGKAAGVTVSKTARSVEARDANGNLIAFYPATIGSEHDPLPVGTWKITGVSRDPVFNYNSDLFWDAKGEHAEAKIPAGPRNPVGVVWIGLSKEHYGIHGTPNPETIGHTQSHGCIRLTNWDASELAALVGPGIPAILRED